MARTLITVLNSLQQGIANLSESYSDAIKKIKVLEEEIVVLQKELEEKELMLLKRENEIEYLKISYQLAKDSDSLIAARQKIARLMKTIDNCISMLEEQ